MGRYVLVSLLLTLSGPVVAEEPSDLVAYLDQIREWGMSESAHTDVMGVSGFRLGHTILTYHKDEQSGRYWPGYRSTTCPNPMAEASEIAEWLEELSREREADIIALRAIADSDESGFVTTEEGHDFRYLVEFGYLAAQLVEAGDGSIEILAVASGLSKSEAQTRLDKYLSVLERARAVGLTMFPEVASGATSPD